MGWEGAGRMAHGPWWEIIGCPEEKSGLLPERYRVESPGRSCPVSVSLRIWEP